jgi:branched-chain amino acid transport system substrate-binding protein
MKELTMRVRRSFAAASVAALAMGVAACGGPGGDSDNSGSGGGADDPIVIGVSLPLTGDFSEPGKGVEQGYRMWEKWINENGGLLDREVEIKIVDDRSNAETVVSDYEAFIANDEVDLIFGPYSSRLVIPSARVAEEYGMLFVQPAGSAAEVFESGFENMFYAAPSVASQNYNYLADHILAMPEAERPKTAAYATMDDPFAQSTAYGLKDLLEAGGIQTVADEVYPPNTTDYSQIAAKLADANADILVGGTQYQDAVNMIVALQQLNYQPMLAAFSTAPTNPEFSDAIGGGTEGILAPTGYTPEAQWPSNVEFVEAYEAEYGEVPGEDQANAFTVGQVVSAAVEAVGCAEQGDCQKELVEWLKNNEVDTVVGPLTWDANGRPEGAHMIQQYVDGEIRIVLPEELAEAEFIFPKPAW